MFNILILIICMSSLAIILLHMSWYSADYPYVLSSQALDKNLSNSIDACLKKDNTYIITLNEFLEGKDLKNTINDFVFKINSSGIKIVDVLEKTGIIIIKPTENNFCDLLLNELKNDSRIKSIEKSGPVKMSNPNN